MRISTIYMGPYLIRQCSERTTNNGNGPNHEIPPLNKSLNCYSPLPPHHYTLYEESRERERERERESEREREQS